MEQKHLDMTQFGCRWLDLQHEKIPHHELNGLIPFLLSTLLDPTEGNSVLDLHILNFCWRAERSGINWVWTEHGGERMCRNVSPYSQLVLLFDFWLESRCYIPINTWLLPWKGTEALLSKFGEERNRRGPSAFSEDNYMAGRWVIDWFPEWFSPEFRWALRLHFRTFTHFSKFISIHNY
jgi:hypothetical protein